MLAEVEPRLRQSLPAGHYAFAVLASEQSVIALARGDVQVALKLADQALAIDEASTKAGGAGVFYLPTLLIRRSAIELEAQLQAELDMPRTTRSEHGVGCIRRGIIGA